MNLVTVAISACCAFMTISKKFLAQPKTKMEDYLLIVVVQLGMLTCIYKHANAYDSTRGTERERKGLSKWKYSE